MSDLARVGVECCAPLKRDRKREYVDVRVIDVTDDGHVVTVETIVRRGSRPKKRLSFPACALRPLGTPTPLAGVVF